MQLGPSLPCARAMIADRHAFVFHTPVCPALWQRLQLQIGNSKLQQAQGQRGMQRSSLHARYRRLMDFCTMAGVISGNCGGRRGGRQPRQRRQQRPAVGRQRAPHAAARLQGGGTHSKLTRRQLRAAASVSEQLPSASQTQQSNMHVCLGLFETICGGCGTPEGFKAARHALQQPISMTNPP